MINKEMFDYENTFCLVEMSKQNGALREQTFNKGKENENRFNYTLLDSKYDWTADVNIINLQTKTSEKCHLDLNGLVKRVEEESVTGFHHGIRGGEVGYFIVPKNVPEEFIPYVLIHEMYEVRNTGVAERCTMDHVYNMSQDGFSKEEVERFMKEEMEEAKKYPHEQGCLAELYNVFGKGEEFSKRYAEWLIKTNGEISEPTTFFNQLRPGFLGENNRQEKIPLQSVIEFYLDIDITPVSIFIKDWPWAKAYVSSGSLEGRVH